MKPIAIIVALFLSLVPDIAPVPAYSIENDVCCENIADSPEEAVIRTEARVHRHHTVSVSPLSFREVFIHFISASVFILPYSLDKLWLVSGNLRL